jgi:hypothetical protein
MINSIEEYLDALKIQMQASDPALLQDALADAREHLSAALSAARAGDSAIQESDVLKTSIDEYGTPEETASAYKEVERRTSPSLKQNAKPHSLLGRFFGVYLDPLTWGSLLFMFITFITGIIYFTWAVTGAALSLSLMILIIGVPFAILFLLSVQGVALFEGRLVEALLGVRMPRRPAFAQPGLKWTQRLRALLTDKHTWVTLLYMILQMPLGVIYFGLLVTLISMSLGLIGAPFVHMFVSLPKSIIPEYKAYYVPLWMLPVWARTLLVLGGLVLTTLTLHLVRAIGRLHGRYAKALLVN